MNLSDIISGITHEPYFVDTDQHGKTIGVIYCADCLEILPQMPEGCVDLVVTDPPYGFERFEGDEKDYLKELSIRTPEVQRVLKRGGYAFFCSGTGQVMNLNSAIPMEFRRMLWLYKPADCTYPYNGWLLTSEAILMYQNGDGPQLPERKPYRHDCYVHRRVGKEGVDGHPTVKPIDVIGDLVSRSEPNWIILDPYSGSGTMAVAAKRLNRQWIIIDRKAEYCAIAKQRLLQMELF